MILGLLTLVVLSVVAALGVREVHRLLYVREVHHLPMVSEEQARENAAPLSSAVIERAPATIK